MSNERSAERRSISRDAVAQRAEAVRELIAQIDSEEVSATPGQRAFLAGSLAALEGLLND